MGLIVYGDVNCPFSYLASRRVSALAAAGVDVEWRAVEHAPELPVPGSRLDAAGRAGIEAEFATIKQLLLAGEEFDVPVPSMTPHTEAAVSGYAEAVGAGVADDVRTLLFDAYWQRGLDVGSPEVLRTLLADPIRRGASIALPLHWSGYAVSANRGPITVDAYRRVRAWRRAWLDLGTATIPTVTRRGSTYAGLDGLELLAAEITRVGALATSDEPDEQPTAHAAQHREPVAAWAAA